MTPMKKFKSVIISRDIKRYYNLTSTFANLAIIADQPKVVPKNQPTPFTNELTLSPTTVVAMTETTDQPRVVPKTFPTANELTFSPKTVTTTANHSILSLTIQVATNLRLSVSVNAAADKKQKSLKRGIKKCKLVHSASTNLKGKCINLYSTIVNGLKHTFRHIDARSEPIFVR